MRAPLTRDRALEVRSLYAQSRDVLRALVSAVGWYCVVDAPDGTRLYAPDPGAVALRLPTDVDVARLLDAGWCPAPRRGWWQRGAATAPRWWQAALAPEGR